MNSDKQLLINNITKIHTTEMGLARIKNNLSLNEPDVVEWCKSVILDKLSEVSRNGKNWYVILEDNVLTINTHSFTIITAHKRK